VDVLQEVLAQVSFMYAFNKQSLADRREDMYAALLKKLEALYGSE